MLLDPDFPTVNRTLLIVHRASPFLDWEDGVVPDIPSVDDDDEEDESLGHPYLLSSVQAEDMDGSLRKLYAERIFRSELLDVTKVESCWPSKRRWKEFQSWFRWEWLSNPCDLGAEPLRRMVWRKGEGFEEKP